MRQTHPTYFLPDLQEYKNWFFILAVGRSACQAVQTLRVLS